MASSSAGLVGDGSSVGTGISWKDRLIGLARKIFDLSQWFTYIISIILMIIYPVVVGKKL